MKIIHTADWHIGNTFYGYDRSDEHRHFLDFLLDSGKICSLLRYHEALSGMLLTGGKLRCLSVTDLLKCFRNRNGILSCICNAFDPADCIGVSLAYALAPEGIVLTIG